MTLMGLNRLAFALAVVAATLMLTGAAVKLLAVGELDPKPLALGLLMVALAGGSWARLRAGRPAPPAAGP